MIISRTRLLLLTANHSAQAIPPSTVFFKVLKAYARPVHHRIHKCLASRKGDVVQSNGSFMYVLSGNELIVVDTRQQGALTISSEPCWRDRLLPPDDLSSVPERQSTPGHQL